MEAAPAARPDPRYAEQAARIRSWLGHRQSREAYVAAQGLIPARGPDARARRPQFIGASFRRSNAGDGLCSAAVCQEDQ